MRRSDCQHKPHVLQLSGIGDPAHLERVGIAVRHALRGVGKHLQDHYLARASCEVQGAPSLNQMSRGLGLVGQVLRYVATGSGILTYGVSLVAASVQVLAESASPDVQCLFAHGSYAPGGGRRRVPSRAATFRHRRSGSSGACRHCGAACSTRRRQELAGPLPRPRIL